jgi:hypothetical protein
MLPGSLSSMHLIQFEKAGGARRVAIVDAEKAQEIAGIESIRDLAWQAIDSGKTLAQQINSCQVAETHEYSGLLAEQKVLPPLDHPDPAHCLVTGTGLTHLGSAAARDQMHQKISAAPEELTDSLKMFRWGVEGGKPKQGQAGVQPEWFYKGDGSIVARPYAPLSVAAFSEDAGEEPEIVGLYLIGSDTRPYRVGFALGNELSDHVMERRNYLYLAHSKLRPCAFGPELLIGPLPAHVAGTSRILRNGNVLWEKPFLSGEDNMSHSLANLEHHHFKYPQFLRPGDLHVHFFGTATLSFADGIKIQDGDVVEISAPVFGRPLVNRIEFVPSRSSDVRAL